MALSRSRRGGDPRGRRAELARQYEQLDEELAGCAYLSGGFGIADIGTFVMANAARTLGAAPDEGQRHLHAWLARTRERPAVRREAEAMGAYAARALVGSTAR